MKNIFTAPQFPGFRFVKFGNFQIGQFTLRNDGQLREVVHRPSDPGNNLAVVYEKIVLPKEIDDFLSYDEAIKNRADATHVIVKYKNEDLNLIKTDIFDLNNMQDPYSERKYSSFYSFRFLKLKKGND